MNRVAAWPVRALVLVAAVAAIAGALHGGAWMPLHYIGKSLATASLALLAGCTLTPVSRRYRLLVCAGLLFCLLGDVCLMLPLDVFVAGLAAFLIAHLLFLAALCGDVRFAASVPALLVCLILAGLVLWCLWPGVSAPMRLPVLVYVLVIALMAGQATGRALVLRGCADLAVSAAFAGVGALLFLLSDTLLAWNRFHAPLPRAPLWVLGSYYAAIACLARSVRARTARG